MIRSAVLLREPDVLKVFLLVYKTDKGYLGQYMQGSILEGLPLWSLNHLRLNPIHLLLA